MRIRQITAAVIEANDWTIVRVASDDGVLGWSEAFCAPGLPETIRELAPLIEGRDARHVEPLVRRLHLSTASGERRRARPRGGATLRAGAPFFDEPA
jgi:L-alanine-DL-glutamate epimerase-like enolase superfamily enzyme